MSKDKQEADKNPIILMFPKRSGGRIHIGITRQGTKQIYPICYGVAAQNKYYEVVPGMQLDCTCHGCQASYQFYRHTGSRETLHRMRWDIYGD